MILDEINTTTHLGMLQLSDVVAFMHNKPQALELIMTGRECPQEIQDAADLVTEMKMIKHYFYTGVPARKGIEY